MSHTFAMTQKEKLLQCAKIVFEKFFSCQMFHFFQCFRSSALGRRISYLLAFHEAAHAFVAYRLGDPTAKIEGQLTLDPFKHIDVFWNSCHFIMHFGWGKPVPVNPSYFKIHDEIMPSLHLPVQ